MFPIHRKGTAVIESKNVSDSSTFTACKWCGQSIAVSHGRGRPKKLCKQSCKQRAYESRKYGIGEMWDHFENTYTNCYICEEPLNWNEPQSMCVDHIIATVHGGRTDIENLRPVHLVCNLRKGYSLIEPPKLSEPV